MEEKEKEDWEEMGYGSPDEILFDMFGARTEQELDDAIDSWGNE